jgi:hypothetical protein
MIWRNTDNVGSAELGKGSPLLNRILYRMRHPRERTSINRDAPISIHWLEILESVFLFTLFLSCTIPYTVLAGSIIISPSEIFAGLFILWRLTTGGTEWARLDRGVKRLIWGFRVFAVWSGLLWLSSSDWPERRGMFLDWLLAALLVECLLRSPWNDWKRIASLYVWAALPTSVWGVMQHAMGIGLAPKDFAGWSSNAASIPIAGFFGHPNDLAVYLYWPLLVCIGLVWAYHSWRRIVYGLLTMLYGLVMYWTISRTTLLAVVFVAILTALVVLIRRRRIFLLAVIAGAVVTAIAISWIFLTIPLDRINFTLSGRLDLWSQSLQLIFSDKYLLPFGYNLSGSGNNPSIWYLPHNIYILSWLEFGWPGILLLVGLAAYLLYSGWKRYEKLRSHFPAAVLWGGLAGLFLIGGMADLYFHEPYVIINFICVLGLWAAQLRWIDSPLAAWNSGEPYTENGPASGKVIPPVVESRR